MSAVIESSSRSLSSAGVINNNRNKFRTEISGSSERHYCWHNSVLHVAGRKFFRMSFGTKFTHQIMAALCLNATVLRINSDYPFLCEHVRGGHALSKWTQISIIRWTNLFVSVFISSTCLSMGWRKCCFVHTFAIKVLLTQCQNGFLNYVRAQCKRYDKGICTVYRNCCLCQIQLNWKATTGKNENKWISKENYTISTMMRRVYQVQLSAIVGKLFIYHFSIANNWNNYSCHIRQIHV